MVTAAATSLAEQQRHAYARAILGEELFGKVADAHVLVVGAGGIGCELLKNLVLVGFGNIEIVSDESRWPGRALDVLACLTTVLFRRLALSPTSDRLGHNRPLESEPPVPLPKATHQKVESARRPRYGAWVQPSCRDHCYPRKRQGGAFRAQLL